MPLLPFPTVKVENDPIGSVGRYGQPPVRGSSASRSPSPTRLNARVVRNRNRPGKNIIHQATVKIWLASESIRPHDGVVWGTPTPRKDRAASNRMLLGMMRVVYTMIEAVTFGRISRNMIRRSLAPRDLADSVNSFSRSERTWPRTMRAMYGQLNRPMIRLTTNSPGWINPPRQGDRLHAAARPRASSRIGSDSHTSIVREITVSILPR